MQLLVCIAKADGELVSRNELMDEIWPRVVVGDVLNNTVAMLRKALGDIRPPRRYVETIPKQGYRMIPPVYWGSGDAKKNHQESLKVLPAKKPSFISCQKPTSNNFKQFYSLSIILLLQKLNIKKMVFLELYLYT